MTSKDPVTSSKHSSEHSQREVLRSYEPNGILVDAQPSLDPSSMPLLGHNAQKRSSSSQTTRNWAKLILNIFLMSLPLVTFIAFNYLGQPEGGRSTPSDSPEWKYTIPRNLNIDHCIEGDKWTPTKDLALSSQTAFASTSADIDSEWNGSNFLQHGVETSFNISLSSDTLFFLSRGQNWNGAVRVKTVSDQVKDSANVHMELRYNHQRAINHTKACLVERRVDEIGIGLFGPVYGKNPLPREELVSTFRITINLPERKQASESPLHIRNFETSFPDTKHEIEDLGRHILFDSFSLKGTNGRVDVKSVAASEASISTIQGAITGTFNTTNKLSLETIMGAIQVDVNLASRDNSLSEFNAQTYKGPIAANIRLTSSSPDKGGIFDVTTSNVNGRLDIKFPESPIDSTLYLAASTTNERASVSLHPAYEGTFRLATTRSDAVVHKDLDVKDPSGKNRRRSIQYSQDRLGTLAGSVFWAVSGQPRDNYGKVNVDTTNAPLRLNL